MKPVKSYRIKVQNKNAVLEKHQSVTYSKLNYREFLVQCDTKEAFFTALKEVGLEFYVRGKTMGVKDLATDRNHRLKTLGLLENFQAFKEEAIGLVTDQGYSVAEAAKYTGYSSKSTL
ncbi:hypothetical protein [Candidatus Vondammii sp. HM_W22]|uniref:hypothetical protein n=1 Tax=Candidatus Vondammii sp. HM_W22 TaxID=2687299 RepID=UPI002E7BB554|nr:hypothetical protein [Candidatus Vondammii sp. HM_W22]